MLREVKGGEGRRVTGMTEGEVLAKSQAGTEMVNAPQGLVPGVSLSSLAPSSQTRCLL